MKIKLKGQYASVGTPTSAPAPASHHPGQQQPESSRGQPLYPHQQPSVPISLQQRQQPQEQLPRTPVVQVTHDDAQEDGAEGQHELAAAGQSSSSSSAADDDEYLNAPLPLPDSSGDEYVAGPSFSSRQRGGRGGSTGRRKGSSRSASPEKVWRPRRGGSIATSEDAGGEEDDEDGEFSGPGRQKAPTGKRRGRPPKSLLGQQSDRKRKTREDSEASSRGEEGEDDSMELDNTLGDSSLVGTPQTGDLDGLTTDNAETSFSMPNSNNVSRSGTATPAGRIVYGFDGKKRGGAAAALAGKGNRSVKGRNYDLGIDELLLPLDEAGEKKVDGLGRLQGGREYKATVFTSNSRSDPERLYMLAIDAARCAGFRDSLYFFRRNPWIHKLNCSQEEKDKLIARGRLHVNLKSRQVTIVTARNCYKVFGARFVKNGKNVTDDYYEEAALARGALPGSPAYSESYDPEIDNTTLAMPKIGNFASKPTGGGRPPYMKMAHAFNAAASGGSVHPSEMVQDDGSRGGRTGLGGGNERAVFDKFGEDEREGDKGRPLAFLKSYHASTFGGIPFYAAAGGASSGAITISGPQFGGNGLAPFGENWERSKARKPAPHLNAKNWMLEYGKKVRAINAQIAQVRKEYSAYHKITLGASGEKAMEEEESGLWELGSESEAEAYEAEDAYRAREEGPRPKKIRREGKKGAESDSEEDVPEEDDRRRGRSSSPRALPANGANGFKHETPAGALAEREGTTTQPALRQRRRRSPLRGFYDAHTRLPQVRTDTQPTRLLSSIGVSNAQPGMPSKTNKQVLGVWGEKVDALPQLTGEEREVVKRAAANLGVASVEYVMVRPDS